MNWGLRVSVILSLTGVIVGVHIPLKATFRTPGQSCVCAHSVQQIKARPNSPVDCARACADRYAFGRPVEWFIINPQGGSCNIYEKESTPGGCDDLMCGAFWVRN